MDKKFDALAEKIFEDENLVKKILNTYDFDLLYDKIRSIEPEISKRELEDFMKSFDKNSLSELTEHDLMSVSGGKLNKSKAMAAVMAMFMGAAPLFSAKAANEVKSTDIRDNKTTTQKVKDWVSGHKVLTSVGAGATFIATMLVVNGIRNKHHQNLFAELFSLSDEGLGAKLSGMNRNDLLELLPELWARFWRVCSHRRPNFGQTHQTAIENVKQKCRDTIWDFADKYAKSVDAYTTYHSGDSVLISWEDAFVDSFRTNGVSYTMVQSDPVYQYNNYYLIDLVKALIGQTKLIQQNTNINQN